MKYGRGYHKYFEGYTEMTVPGKNGKGTRIQRVYTSEFYQQNVTDNEWKKQRVTDLLLYLFGIFSLIFALLQKTEGNARSIMVLPSMLTIVSLIWLSYGFVPYLLAGRKLMLRQYRERDTVIAGGAVASMGMFLCSIAELVSWFLYAQSAITGTIVSIVFFIFGAGAFLQIHRNEKRAEFIRVENETITPLETGYDIRYGTSLTE